MQTTNLHLKKQHGMWETLPSRWFLASKGWFIRKYHLTNITRLKLSKLENQVKFTWLNNKLFAYTSFWYPIFENKTTSKAIDSMKLKDPEYFPNKGTTLWMFTQFNLAVFTECGLFHLVSIYFLAT